MSGNYRLSMLVFTVVACVGTGLGITACGTEDAPQHRLTFEELRASAFEESPGRYVIESDMTFDEAGLARYYENVLAPELDRAELEAQGLSESEDALTINRVWGLAAGACTTSTLCPPTPCVSVWMCHNWSCGWEQQCAPTPPCITTTVCNPPVPALFDDVFAPATVANLSFCIADEVGATNKARLVTAATNAANAWNAVSSRINFRYLSGEDANCNALNSNVLFRIHTNFTNPPYAARAFFPSEPERTVQVNFNTLTNPRSALTSILTHEFGHILGFRHEHIRSAQSSVTCMEPIGNTRNVTAYDGNSVMHYSSCSGALANANRSISALDRSGAISVYGP